MKITKKKFIKILKEEASKILKEQVTVDPSSKPQNSKSIKVGPNVPQEVPQMVVGDDHQPYTVEFDVPDANDPEDMGFYNIFIRPHAGSDAKDPQNLFIQNNKARIHVWPMGSRGKTLYSLVQSKEGAPVYKGVKLHPTPEGATIEYLKLVLNLHISSDFYKKFRAQMRPEAQEKYNRMFNEMKTWNDQRWLRYLKFEAGEGFHALMKRALNDADVDGDGNTIIVRGKRLKPKRTYQPRGEFYPIAREKSAAGDKPVQQESLNYIQTIIKEEVANVLKEQKVGQAGTARTVAAPNADQTSTEKYGSTPPRLRTSRADLATAAQGDIPAGTMLDNYDIKPGQSLLVDVGNQKMFALGTHEGVFSHMASSVRSDSNWYAVTVHQHDSMGSDGRVDDTTYNCVITHLGPHPSEKAAYDSLKNAHGSDQQVQTRGRTARTVTAALQQVTDAQDDHYEGHFKEFAEWLTKAYINFQAP